MFAELNTLRARMALRAVQSLGERPVVRGSPWIGAEGTIRIGSDFRFSSSPAQSHLVAKPGAILEIGDRVVISHGAAIAAFLNVHIGSDTRIGPFVVVMDNDFHAAGGAAEAESAPIWIGAGVSIGSRVTILRGSVIGDGASVRPGSVVSGSVPGGVTVGGVPARLVGTASSAHGDEADVLAVIQSVFNLRSRPERIDGPDTIAGWDSLGALRLLLALEESFEITLSEEAFRAVRTVAELQGIVEKTRLASAASA